MLNTPILFLVFNRLETTKQVFAQIRKVEPRQLFIGSDGTRTNKEGEADKVQAVRQYILENINWNCEVKTLFREENLGCGKAVSEAITWFFDHVEQGIILEDDTLPDLSFFPFCEELLEKYKDDKRFCQIGGNNFNITLSFSYSYFFTKYVSIWGWATWGRAWRNYDFDMKMMKEMPKDMFYSFFPTQEAAYRYALLNDFAEKRNYDTWDYQWFFCNLLNNALTILPTQNLITNLGFGEDATHTTNPNSPHYKLKTNPITFPLQHPPYLIRSDYYENELNKHIRKPQKASFFQRIRQKISSILHIK
jgi:hypothetical protein